MSDLRCLRETAVFRGCSVWLLFLFAILLPFAAGGTTIYVRVSGNDTADGLSPQTALRSVAEAARRVANPGDTIVIGPGTYREGNITPARNGIRGRPVTFRGDPSGLETGDSPGPVQIVATEPATTGFLLMGNRFIVLMDLEVVGGVDAGVQVRASPDGQSSANIVLRRLKIRDSAKRGVDLGSVRGSVAIEECEVNGNATGGIVVEGDGSTTEVAVLNNVVTGNGGNGVFIRAVSAGNVFANDVRNNTGSGLLLRASRFVSVVENRFAGNGESAVNAGSLEPVSDVTFEDNLAESAGRTALVVVGSGEIRIQRNTVATTGNSSGSGIFVENGGDEGLRLSLIDNQVEGASEDCLFVRGATVAEVETNTLRFCGGNGVRLDSVGTGRLIGNTVSDVLGRAVWVTGGTNFEFVGNSLQRLGGAGVAVVGGATPAALVRVTRAKIRQAGGAGISIIGADTVRITDTVIGDGPGDGVRVRQVSRVQVRHSQMTQLGGAGLTIGADDELSARSVRVEEMRAEALGAGGIKVWASGAVSVARSEILDSGGPGLSVIGQSLSRLEIWDSVLGMHQADGVFVRGAQSGSLVNNRIFSNRQSGMTLRGSRDLLIANNLIYTNQAEGIGVGTGGEPSVRTTVVFNTVYQNGSRGLRIDGGSETTPIEGGMVLNNIFAQNQGGGMAIARTAMWNFVAGFNVVADGYAPDTRRNPFDLLTSPSFIDPSGPDGILGERGFHDDDFRLAHRRTGQPANSAGVDAGSDLVSVLGVSGSTSTDGLPDAGRADAGFHYGASAASFVGSVPVPFMPLYVRAAGSDENDGRHPDNALRSVRGAFERAVAGVTVVVGPGTYSEGDIRIRNFSGRVTFLADPTGFLTGDLPGPVLVDATGFDTGFVLLGGGPVSVRGFHVTGATQAGIQVRTGANGAEIADNVVFSNQRRGIEVNGADNVRIRNNLIYDNGTGGIQLQASRNTTVEGNTVFANGADGILVGTTAAGGSAPYATLRRNIVANNGERIAAANGVQVKVETNSREGWVSEYNVVWGRTPFAGNTPRSESDLVTPPMFENPAGADGVIGKEGFADDDFTLQQRLSDGTPNPAIDLDPEAIDVLRWGSTSKLETPDLGPADAGFHYLVFHPTISIGPPVYVRQGGDDRNDGAAPERAVRTLDRGLALAGRAGFVVAGPGRYVTESLSLGSPGNASEVLTLWGDETGVLTGDAPGPVVLDFAGGRGLTIRGSAVIHGLWLTSADKAGMRILSTASRVWVRNSVFCGNGGDGIWAASSAIDLLDNLFCGNSGWGVRLTPKRGSGYVRLVNATVAQNLSGGVWAVDRTRTHAQIRLANNIIAGNLGTGAMLHVGSGRVIPWGHNLNADGFSKARVEGSGEQSVAPEFASQLAARPPACPDQGAYRLSAASPARDAGAGDVRWLGLTSRSATVEGTPDLGPPDLGYHGVVVR
ncbi:MAG: hypothetical protein KatS3mg077_1022 [Candidatus Binatia bacterium]|nr:MAG: hypothetical protein KatS3mg077_1022 [Candidatus Binatia bacterium]